MGINPVAGMILGFLAFVVLSLMIFYKVEQHAAWLYMAIAVMSVLKTSGRERNEKLNSIFSNKDYRLIRIIENSIIIVPFVIILFIMGYYLHGLSLLPITILLALIKIRSVITRVIPTPFRKYPFEFVIGFRLSFWAIALAYYLIFQAYLVDNYNLGLFALVLIFFTSLFYYQKPEPEFYVWIHTQCVNQFLLKKLIASYICIAMLSLLALAIILFCFPDKWLVTILVYAVAYIILGSMILAKYSAFPQEMNIPQGLLYAVSVMFPPLLLFTIWIFYAQSKKKLRAILEC